MYGNFSAEHMQFRTGEKDIYLSAGMAFMVNLEAYKADLMSGKESIQPSICNTYKAIPLNKQIPIGLTWMLQASEQLLAAMGSSSFLLQW
ncbi:hypothetical protein V8E53_011817 [Lactarius tabidus]